MQQSIEIAGLVALVGIGFMLGWIIRKIAALRDGQDVVRAVLGAIHMNSAYARHNSGRLMVHELGLRELDTVPEFLSPQDQSVERIDDTPR